MGSRGGPIRWRSANITVLALRYAAITARNSSTLPKQVMTEGRAD